MRGLAILMVMAVHFVGDAPATSWLQRAVVKAASYGVLGVDLFFVLSGFLITGLLLEAKGQPHYFRNFYARRTLRIFPLYYGVLAALFIVIPALVTPSPLLEQAREHQLWLWTYTTNFYIAATSSWSSLTYVTHFWSLAIEEHFYLVWPLVVLCFRRPVLERVCLGIIVAGLGLRIGLVARGDERAVGLGADPVPHRHPRRRRSARASGPPRGRRPAADRPRRASGPRAARGGDRRLGLRRADRPVVTGAPPGPGFALRAALRRADPALDRRERADALAHVFQGRVLRFFGKYSYGLYVYHGLFTWYLVDVHANERLDRWFGDRHALTIVARAVLGVSVSVLVAVLSYELMEKKFLALKRYFAPEASSAPLPAPAAGEALLTTSPAPPPSGVAGR